MKILILLFLITVNSFAKDLGNFGQTFNIVESDLLIDIQNKLHHLEASGALGLHQTKVQQKVAAKIKQPTKVANIAKTSVAKTFLYDPSIKVPYDLVDHKGQVFVLQGHIVNPLATQSLTKSLLFIDGDDDVQVRWAVTQPFNSKIILVGGAPLKLSAQYKKRFYFDQHGVLVKKFGILHVPAKVSQKDHLLQIEEIVVDE